MNKPFVLALTGSIGMGKSTAAGFFREEGVPVWDADEVVSRLYARGGAAVPLIEAVRPEAVKNGAVDRGALKQWILADDTALGVIENIVHPLVALDRSDFLGGAEALEEPIVVLDIPLLYETGAAAGVDAVAVVSAPADVQRARVLARPGMSEEAFDFIMARQMPDAEKRQKADYIIPSINMKDTRTAVHSLIDRLRSRVANA